MGRKENVMELFGIYYIIREVKIESMVLKFSKGAFMRKFIASMLLGGVVLFGASAQIHQGWNLVGAASGINPSQITSANTIWTFRAGDWYLYKKNSTSTNNYGQNKLNQINATEGFWVNAQNDDTINFQTDSSNMGAIYSAYGLTFQDRKTDDRYTVSNSLGTNGVTFNQSNQTFTLSAYKKDKADSRAGLRILSFRTHPAQSVSVNAKLSVSGESNHGRNRLQLNANNIPLKGDYSHTLSTGMILSQQGASIWFEKDSVDGSWVDIGGVNLSNADMRGKNITATISISGTKIMCSIKGDDINNISKVVDTRDLNATISGLIGGAEIRARVRGVATDDNSIVLADSSKVVVNDIKVGYLQDADQAAYSAYGLYLQDKKNHDNYLISNSLGTNGVSFNQSNNTFTLNAYKQDQIDSRAGLDIKNTSVYPAKSISVTAKLHANDTTTGYSKNRMQLSACGIPLAGTHEYDGCTGMSLSSAGAYVWYGKENLKDWGWEDISDFQFGTEDMRGKNVTMKIEINGTKISYSITGDVNHEVTKDTSETNATISGNIRYASIRARLDDRNDDPAIGTNTKVDVSDIKVEYAQ